MPAFRFRAEAVLELRRAEEARAEAALAAAQARFRAADAALAAAEAARAGARDEAARLVQRGTDQDALGWHRNWIVGLTSAVERQRDDTARARAAADEAARAWRDARRRRLALERLRERARERHLAEERRREMRTMDELAGLRFAGSRGGLTRDRD